MNRFLRALWPYGLLLLAVFLAYANVYDNGFVLDDEMLVQKNQYLRHAKYLKLLLTHCSTAGFGGEDSFYRPLQGLLYFLIYQHFHLALLPFHLLNVGLHAANACLVYTLGRKLGFAKSATLAASLLWAVHPVHTEAVAYISATADPLYAFFVLLGLVVLFPTFAFWRFIVSALFFALALVSKETAIILPGLVILCQFWQSPNKKSPWQYLKVLPLLGVALFYFWARTHLLGLDDFAFYKEPNYYSSSMWVRFLTFLATIPPYLHAFFWPDNLHMDHMFKPVTEVLNLAVMGGALVVSTGLFIIGRALFTKGKDATVAFGAAWFPTAHVLHSGVFLAVNAMFLEHWLYLPTVGLMLGCAEAIHTRAQALAFSYHRQIITSVVGMLVVLLGLVTYQQNKTWSDPITFYEHILSFDEPSAGTHNNLAMAYSEKGDNEKAIAHYRAAIAANDNFAQTHYNLGIALFNGTNDLDQKRAAVKELEKAIEMNPSFFQAYEGLSQMHKILGDAQKAESFHKREVEILKNLLPDVN